jgi:UDP-glucose 4-epimerase
MEENMTTHFVFGGAGFIGTNLINELLLNESYNVVCIDNLSRGKMSYIEKYMTDNRFEYLNIDISDETQLSTLLAGYLNETKCTAIWHLAANSDIPAGISDISIDLKNTFNTTVNILKWMKSEGLDTIYFASSSAIYGDHKNVKLHEAIGNCHPISNYGAMKLASEATISAAAESYLERAVIFRFPNVIGVPATHGVIYDFINKLKNNRSTLDVLGNGTQQKSYLHVSDLISAMLFLKNQEFKQSNLNVFNIGPDDEAISVSQIADIVSNLIQNDVQITYGTADRGWVGDIPRFSYSTDKLKALGWLPTMNSERAVEKAAKEIYAQLLG